MGATGIERRAEAERLSAIYVERGPLRPEHEIPLCIRHVIAQHRASASTNVTPPGETSSCSIPGFTTTTSSAASSFVSSPIVIVTAPSTIHVTCSAVSFEWRRTTVPGA